MLTLAVAQIVYAVAFQWVDLTGGDNGIVGVWPSPVGIWSRDVYYYLTLVLSVASIAGLARSLLFTVWICAPRERATVSRERKRLDSM